MLALLAERLAAGTALGGIWSFIKAHAALFGVLAFGIAMLISVAVVYDRGQTAGADKVTTVVAQQHAATVEIARKDEQVAQKASDAAGAKVAVITQQNHTDTLAQIQEINDELAALKKAQPTSAVAVAVVPDSVRKQSNAAIASANGSAVYTGPAN